MSDQIRPVFKLFEDNYACLHRHYRLGDFERAVCYTDVFPASGHEPGLLHRFMFVDSYSQSEDSEPKTIRFQSAIEELYSLTRYLSQQADLLPGDKVLLLRCKCLVYEAKDNVLAVPEELAKELSEIAKHFQRSIEQAEELKGARFNENDTSPRSAESTTCTGNIIPTVLTKPCASSRNSMSTSTLNYHPNINTRAQAMV